MTIGCKLFALLGIYPFNGGEKLVGACPHVVLYPCFCPMFFTYGYCFFPPISVGKKLVALSAMGPGSSTYSQVVPRSKLTSVGKELEPSDGIQTFSHLARFRLGLLRSAGHLFTRARDTKTEGRWVWLPLLLTLSSLAFHSASLG